MNMPRSLERFIRFLLDECCPPVLRDSRLFMWLPIRLAFGRKAAYFMEFKEKVAEDHEGVLAGIYGKTGDVRIREGGTDLSDAVSGRIAADADGRTVLDVGCGGGFLAGLLSVDHEVTACDIALDPSLGERWPKVRFREGDLQDLPFQDRSFDTVTCTHTLEHVWDPAGAVAELRRVAARRIIVVVPRERPYRFSFNLHLQFFRFEYQLRQLFEGASAGSRSSLELIDGCWYYLEDMV